LTKSLADYFFFLAAFLAGFLAAFFAAFFAFFAIAFLVLVYKKFKSTSYKRKNLNEIDLQI
jgi:hypothetical protein